MRKNKIIQFSLVIAALFLFFFTYHSNEDKAKIAGVDKNASTKLTNKLTDEMSSIIENHRLLEMCYII